MNGDNGVQLYSAHARELKHTQQHKVMKFVEHSCVEYDKEHKVFLCKPIEGYNSTTYEIKNSREFEWECNCQGFQSAKRRYEKDSNAGLPSCSHIGAVWEWVKRHNIVKVPQRVSMGMQMVLEV